MRTRLLTVLSVLAGGVVPLAAAAPAHAALPSCTSSSQVTLRIDGVLWATRVPTRSGSYECRLNQGSVGSAVSALQTSLRRCNARTAIAVDGRYGPATRSAVVTFQRWYNARSTHDIAVDGGYGPQTGTAMAWYLTRGSSSRCAPVLGIGGA